MTNGFSVALQILPTGMGPEGLKAIAKRGLFIASTEKEVADDGIPTMVNIFRLSYGAPAYPMIQSDTDYHDNPIPWVALSGMVGDAKDPRTLYAVSDSFLAEGYIYTIYVNGNFWLGSEGNADTLTQSRTRWLCVRRDQLTRNTSS